MEDVLAIDASTVTDNVRYPLEKSIAGRKGHPSGQDLMDRCWAAIRQSSNFDVDPETGVEYLKVLIRTEDKRYPCPLPGCDKSFSSDLGLNYHFTHAEHDVCNIILSVLSSTGASESDLERQREELFQQVNDAAAEGYFPIQQPIVIYYHGTRRRDLFVIFGRGKPQTPGPSSDGSIRKRSRTSTSLMSDMGGSSALSQSYFTSPIEALEPPAPAPVAVEPLSPPQKPISHEPVFIRHYLYPEIEIDYLEKGGAPVSVDEDRYQFPNWQTELEAIEILSIDEGEKYMPEKTYSVNVTLSSRGDLSDTLNVDLRCLKTVVFDRNAGGCVLNAGACIWGMAWCPLIRSGMAEDHHYLALAGYKDIGESQSIGSVSTGPGWIQIWRFQGLADTSLECEEPCLDMVIGHDYGTVWDLKWCPRRGSISGASLKRMGILAAAFGDGNVRLFSVPSPLDLKEKLDVNLSTTLVVKFQPCLKLDLNNAIPWTISWSPDDACDYLAAGCTDGSIRVWNLGRMHQDRDPIRPAPCRFIQAHDDAVRSVDFCPFNPNYIASCGHDGKFSISDVRDPFIPVMTNRARAQLTSVSWPEHGSGVLYTDGHGAVKCILLQPGVNESFVSKRIMEYGFALWHIASSWLHPVIASTCADGTLRLGIMSEKKLRGRRLESIAFRIRTELDPLNLKRHKLLFDEMPQESELEKTKLFPPEESIHRAAWNPNIIASSWIACATALGVIRVFRAVL